MIADFVLFIHINSPLSLFAVREFLALAEWAEQDTGKVAALKNLLRLNQGWVEARDHARMVSYA